jgi:pimeloyl-ACP methyl ester carboxylesterase/DNA-binding CsgD family transcriptional regulator
MAMVPKPASAMSAVSAQAVRFCASFDATRIAFAVTGRGPVLVKAPHWLTHLEYEWQSPLWRPWIAALSTRHTLLRMDARASGLSDWQVNDIAFEAYVRDLEAVVAAAGCAGRFAMFGHSQGAAIAVEFAARHPQRVSHLVILGGYARGIRHRGLPPDRLAEHEALLQLIQAGWGREDDAYRRLFAMQFVPDATLEQIKSLSDLQRHASSPANAARLVRSFHDIDVTASAPRVRCPALVVHARGDRRVPYEEGRLLAGLVPNARFVSLDTDNHILLPQESAFAAFFTELDAFLGTGAADAARRAFASLTPREAEILERMARGLDNAQIAAQLELAEKTVRNAITRIFRKLQVESRSQAIVLALRHGIGQD